MDWGKLLGDLNNAFGGAVQGVENFFGAGGGGDQQPAAQPAPQPVAQPDAASPNVAPLLGPDPQQAISQAAGYYPSIQDQIAANDKAKQQVTLQQLAEALHNSTQPRQPNIGQIASDALGNVINPNQAIAQGVNNIVNPGLTPTADPLNQPISSALQQAAPLARGIAQGTAQQVGGLGVSVLTGEPEYTPSSDAGRAAAQFLTGNETIPGLAEQGKSQINSVAQPFNPNFQASDAAGTGLSIAELAALFLGPASKTIKFLTGASDAQKAEQGAAAAAGVADGGFHDPIVPESINDRGPQGPVTAPKTETPSVAQSPGTAEPKLIQLHHGTSSDVTVDSLRAGTETGLERGQNRRLLYASDNPDVAREYANGRGTSSGDGRPNMLTFNFGGRVLDQNSPTYVNDLRSLIENPDFSKLSGRSRNQLTNIYQNGEPVGALDGGILETNDELTKYLTDHGYDAVKIHHTPFGGKLDTKTSTQTVILNPQKILRPVEGGAPITGTAPNGQRYVQEPGKAPEPVSTFTPEQQAAMPGPNPSLLPLDNTKNSIWMRMGGSKLTNIRNASPKAGPELADTVNAQLNDASLRANSYLKNQPSVWQLGKKEFSNFADVLQGKADPLNDKVAQAAQEAQSTLKDVHGDATASGLPVGNQADYFPHTYSAKYMKSLRPGTPTFNAAVNHLMETGQAVDAPTAIQMLQDFRKSGGGLGASKFGNFQSRDIDLPGYEKTKDAYARYLSGAADATARANAYGVNNEKVFNLLANIGHEGGDTGTATKAMSQILHPDHANAVVNNILKGFSFARLGKASIAHAGQSINTAADAGILNTVKGAFAKDRDYLDKVGHNSDMEIHGLRDQEVISKGTAPLLNQVMRWNRDTGAMAGKYFGDEMAKQGRVDVLRRFGVTGDIGSTLTEDQQIQMSRSMVNRNLFRSTPADTPINAETTGGRVIGQYRLAYLYKQTGKLYDMVNQASHGNVAPLVRFIALGIPVGMGVTATKNLITGHDESKDSPYTQILHVAENGGMLGVPGAVLSAANAVHDVKTGVEGGVGLIAPVAGEATKIVNATRQAIAGKPAAAIHYAAGLIPAVGTRIGNAISPPAPPDAIAFAKSQQAAQNSLKDPNDLKAYNDATSKYFTPDGKPMKPTALDRMTIAQELLKQPAALAALQQQAQDFATATGQPLDPKWALSGNGQDLTGKIAPKIQVFENYASQATGSPERAVLEQNNPWIQQLKNDRTAFFNDNPLPAAAQKEANSDPTYPLTPAEGDLMHQSAQITDPAQKQQFYIDHPELNDIEQRYGKYVNEMRVAEEKFPLPTPPVMTPDQQALLKAFSALPKGNGPKGGSPNRSAFIKANQGAWNDLTGFFAKSSEYQLTKQGAMLQVSGQDPATDQKFLKAAYSLGKYDITKDPASGLYAIGTNPTGGTNNYGGGGGSRGSSMRGPRLRIPKFQVAPHPKPVATGGGRAMHIKVPKGGGHKGVKIS